MATIKTATYPGQSYSASKFKSFIDSFSCSLIITSLNSNTLNINVNNIVIVVLNMDNGRTQVIYNGTTTNYSLIDWYNSATITAACGNNIFYLQFNCEYGLGRRFVFLYELLDNTNYWGATGAGTETGSGHAWYSITDIPMIEVGPEVPTTHKALLNYSAQAGYINYAHDSLFQNDLKVKTDSNFKACTTVPSNKIVTFGGKNYYSIGPNTLLEIG